MNQGLDTNKIENQPRSKNFNLKDLILICNRYNVELQDKFQFSWYMYSCIL